MYIRKIEITNIKGIDHFEMDFSKFSKLGWHVLIGDNGSGKTTILRCIAMALLPLNESHATNLYNGIQTSKWTGSKIDAGYVRWWNERSANNELESSFELKFDLSNHISGKFPANFMYNIYDTVVRKIFSCGYGSFRILSGRNDTFFQSGYRSKFRTLFSE